MYVIKADEHVVHDGYINDRDYVAIAGNLRTEFNRAGTLSFTVPQNNLAYQEGYLKKLISVIRVYDGNKKLLWKGRIIDTSKDFYNNVTFNCEGWLGVLNDSVIRPNGTGTSGGGSGSAVERATTWMENLANDSAHGYDQAYRWGEQGDYDCSSAVITAWEYAGVPVKTNGAVYTGNMYGIFTALGFTDVTADVNLATGEGLVRGDVLLNHERHVAMYCGNGQEVEALANENGGLTGGQPGDQTGNEIAIRAYRNFPWNAILRYPGGGGESGGATSPVGTVIRYNLTDAQIRGLANVFYSEQGSGDAGIRACASHLCNRFEKWPISGLNDPYNYLIYSGWWGSASLNLARINGSAGTATEANVQAVSEVIREGKRTLPLFIDEYDQLADVAYATNNGVAINKDDRSAYVKDTTTIVNIYATSPEDKYTFWGFPDGVAGVTDAFGYISKPPGAIDFIPADAASGGTGSRTDDVITIDPATYFVWLIQNHNEQVGADKALNVMMPENVFSTPVTFPAANYDTTLDYIQNNFLANEEVGGRIWIEENNIYYYPDGTEATSPQPFEFGNNLLDLTESYDASEVFTSIIPTGKDGLSLYPTYPADYINSPEGCEKYGIIVRHVDFSDVEDVATLAYKATEMLAKTIEATMSIEISAFDLGLTNPEAGEIKVGTFVEVRSTPHDLEKAYICTVAEIDICNPANTKYILGVNADTLTTKQMKMIKNLTSSTGYTAELPSYNTESNVYDERVEIRDITFRRTGHAAQLLFNLKVLKAIPANSEGYTVLTFATMYAPTYAVRFQSGYNETTRKSFTVIVTSEGQVQISTADAMAVDDVITGNANWTYV